MCSVADQVLDHMEYKSVMLLDTLSLNYVKMHLKIVWVFNTIMKDYYWFVVRPFPLLETISQVYPNSIIHSPITSLPLLQFYLVTHNTKSAFETTYY